MNNVKLYYTLYRNSDKTHIKLKGSKLQIARGYLQLCISVIRSITDPSMQEIQNSRYELLKKVCYGTFTESEDGIYIMLQLPVRQLELLHKEMKNGCFSTENDDVEEYYGAWALQETS